MKIESKPTTGVIPCPVILLSVEGGLKPNIITLSWVANVCSKPPSVAVGIRPERYSYDLVKEAGNFVLNIPAEEQFEAAKLCGTKSGRDIDKFAECGFHAVPSSKISSPLIEECPINLECEVREVISPGVHDLFIAEVVAFHMDESVTENGRFDPQKMKAFTYLPLAGQYWSLGERM
ncbi:MAG: flavin reductase family protein [Candidatus Lokiarchaeota archaeon]|nr:flavin reductase family protein [Candidatus Lokiarchaeota archaeon]